MKRFGYLSFLLMVCIWIPSCKKSNSDCSLQLVQINDNLGLLHWYRYDSQGRIESWGDSSIYLENDVYTYNGGHMVKYTLNDSGTHTYYTKIFGYDADGKRVTCRNYGLSGALASVDSFVYNGALLFRRLELQGVTDTVGAYFTYQYDNSGNIAKTQYYAKNGGNDVLYYTDTYTYDDKVNPSYHDYLGDPELSHHNIISHKTTDAGGAVTLYHSYSFTYKSNGCPMTCSYVDSTPGAQHFAYVTQWIYKCN